MRSQFALQNTVASNIGISQSNVSVKVLTLFFFFNDTATTEIYTLSLHDALPISFSERQTWMALLPAPLMVLRASTRPQHHRSEEHTSELQSHSDIVCRLLLEKKKDNRKRVSERTDHGKTLNLLNLCNRKQNTVSR